MKDLHEYLTVAIDRDGVKVLGYADDIAITAISKGQNAKVLELSQPIDGGRGVQNQPVQNA